MGIASKFLQSILFVTLGSISDVWAQEKFEPLIDIRKNSRISAAPSPEKVERAYSACLKGVDAELAQVNTGVASRKGARRAEEEVCHRARRACIEAPSSADCRGFVVDYTE